MKNITVLGTGVLGSQIAFQTAFHGFDAVSYTHLTLPTIYSV